MRQRVLLAAESADEPPAAHEAAILEPSQCPLDVAPRHPERIVDGEVAEHDAPAVDELLGDGLGELVAVHVVAAAWHDGPPPRRGAPTGAAPQPRHAAAFRRAADAADPGPDGAEAVAHDEPARHTVPEPSFDVVGEPAGGVDEVGGEARAAVAQDLHDLGRRADRG